MKKNFGPLKQKEIAMIEPPPYDELMESKISQNRNIINELGLIKARVNQVMHACMYKQPYM